MAIVNQVDVFCLVACKNAFISVSGKQHTTSINQVSCLITLQLLKHYDTNNTCKNVKLKTILLLNNGYLNDK